MSERRDPILVTGLHRGGTSWVGRMLNLSGETAYVSEPLNVHRRPGAMKAKVAHWYQYICEENENEYLEALHKTLALRYGWGRELASLRSLKDFGRMLRDGTVFGRGRALGQRPLLKDPFALFSAGWFAKRLGCAVVLVVRHPAGFVSSLKRLGWTFDFGDLLAQPLLMRDWLKPYKKEMEREAQAGDVIAQGSLLWRMGAAAMAKMQKMHPEFLVRRHEDLSSDPAGEFEMLYEALELGFTEKARRGIERATGSGNPEEVSMRSIYSTRLDSAANLENWKQRLSAEEIERVRALTQAEVKPFYGAEDWA